MVTNTGYSSIDKNHALCRKYLDFIPNGNFESDGYEECRDMVFLKVNGLTRFWETEKNFQITGLIGDILNSFVRHGIPFSYVIISDGEKIDVYVGTLKVLRDSLKSSYESEFPGVDIDYVNENPLRTSPCTYGGMFTGIPTNKLGAEKKSYQIENVCRGMQGKKFTYVILASGISNIAVTLGHERILNEMENTFPLINQTVSGGSQGNISAQKQDFNSKDYFENLEVLEKDLKNGMSRGTWRVNGYFASDNQLDAKLLGNIIKASFSGDESKPEPFRVTDYKSIRDVIVNTYMQQY